MPSRTGSRLYLLTRPCSWRDGCRGCADCLPGGVEQTRVPAWEVAPHELEQLTPAEREAVADELDHDLCGCPGEDPYCGHPGGRVLLACDVCGDRPSVCLCSAEALRAARRAA